MVPAALSRCSYRIDQRLSRSWTSFSLHLSRPIERPAFASYPSNWVEATGGKANLSSPYGGYPLWRCWNAVGW